MTNDALHHIVVVGGGAAGLELATKLGDRLGRRTAKRASRWSTAAAPTSGSRSCIPSPRGACAAPSTSSITSPRRIGTISATATAK